MALPLRIDPDPFHDETVIEGVRYANAVFRSLGLARPGQLLRILGREGETVRVERVPDREDGLADQVAILTKTHFVPGDVIVYRGPHHLATTDLKYMWERAPHLKDTVIVAMLPPDGDLYALPEDEARKLYAHLHARFGGRS